VVPRGGGRRGSSESGELARARGWERAGKGSPPPKGSIPGLDRVWEVAGEPCCGAAEVRLGRQGTSSCPRGSWLGLCAARGRGWLGEELVGTLSMEDKGERREGAWPTLVYSRGGSPPVPASSQDWS
jgi:hypothetical protein